MRSLFFGELPVRSLFFSAMSVAAPREEAMITMFETTMSRLDRLEGMLEASERREMRMALDRQRNAYKSDDTDEDEYTTVFNPYVELDDGQIVESSLKQVFVRGGVRDSCRLTVVFSKGTLSTVWWNPSGGELGRAWAGLGGLGRARAPWLVGLPGLPAWSVLTPPPCTSAMPVASFIGTRG